MSKLPNAPLIEVIFELSWIANTSKEHEKFQFLLGNMYNKLKDTYPKRFNLVQMPIALPFDIFNNKPMYRFRKEENSYPLYQLGPGLLSINTVDSVYIWEHFEEEIQRILSVFKDSYDFDNNTRLNVALKYIDFYPFDFNENLRLFLSDNLHLEIKDNVPMENTPNLLTFSTGYNTEKGQFNYSISRASKSKR